MTDNQEKRAAVYIDGFNLYHPIKEMAEDFLKWNNLRGLAENIAKKGGCELVKTVFCTAVPAHLPDSRDRHNIYNRVQEAKGVVIRKGKRTFPQHNNC